MSTTEEVEFEVLILKWVLITIAVIYVLGLSITLIVMLRGLAKERREDPCAYALQKQEGDWIIYAGMVTLWPLTWLSILSEKRNSEKWQSPPTHHSARKRS